MKKLVFRLLAYVMDFVIILLISNLIVFCVPSLKSANNDASKSTKEYYDYNNTVEKIKSDLESAYEDEVITEDESLKLFNKYNKNTNVIKKTNEDVKVSDKDLEKVLNSLEEERLEKNNKLIYVVNKKSRGANITRIIVGILYLGVIQFIFKGVTLGKKIFRLRTISDKGDVSLIKYIIRSILITEALIIGADIIAISTTNFSGYLAFSGVMAYIKYFYELAFMICMVARNDQKSLHDVILNTRVALYDKEGNEVEDIIFAEVQPVKEEVKEVKTTKSPKQKKTPKKEKEVVKAEKM